MLSVRARGKPPRGRRGSVKLGGLGARRKGSDPGPGRTQKGMVIQLASPPRREETPPGRGLLGCCFGICHGPTCRGSKLRAPAGRTSGWKDRAAQQHLAACVSQDRLVRTCALFFEARLLRSHSAMAGSPFLLQWRVDP